MQPMSFAVLGLGRFGTSVAQELSERGYEVIAVDKDPERVANIADRGLRPWRPIPPTSVP